MSEGNSKETRDWLKLVAVVGVGVVLAGVGTILVSNLAPSSITAGAVIALASTTTQRQIATSTLPTPVVATAATSPATSLGAVPAAIEMSESIFDFGDTATTASFDLTNTRGVSASWSIQSSTSSVSTSPEGGDVGAGGVETVSITVHRETLDEGEWDAILTLVWGGGEQQIFVRGLHSDNPIIIGPTATPSTVYSQGLSACDPAETTITVRVKDTSELAEVVVRWSGGGDGSLVDTPMATVDGENYQAVIGPFNTIAPPIVKVVARDIHDNAGGAPVPLAVVACP